MPKLLYHVGACSLAPHIVLEWIGAPYEAQSVEFGSAELRAINPSGAVPALIEDDGWILTQAGAILHYLATSIPMPIWPAIPMPVARRNWTAGPAFSPATCIPAFTRSSRRRAIRPAAKRPSLRRCKRPAASWCAGSSGC